MTATESPADLLRRAADRLTELDAAAPEGPWEPGCAWDTGVQMGPDRGSPLLVPSTYQEDRRATHRAAVALILALRPAGSLLASIMYAAANAIDHEGRGSWRSEDDRQEAMSRYAQLGYGRLLGYARTVLGETEG